MTESTPAPESEAGKTAESSESTRTAAATPEPRAEATRKLGTRAIAIVAAIALVVLAGVGVGIYLLTKGDDGPAAAGAPPAGGDTTAAPPASTGSAPPSTPGSTGGQAPAAEVGNAKVVAEKAIAAINSHNAEQMRLLSCDPEVAGPVDGSPPEARAELVSAPELSGDTATVEVKLTIGDQSVTTPLPLRKVNGNWCVD
jgi:hypothetical protein